MNKLTATLFATCIAFAGASAFAADDMEAIGIEMVGRAALPVGFKPISEPAKWTLERQRGEFGIFATPTAAQNLSLSWLVKALEDSMQIPSSEIFRHPVVSRKNPTEARGANWSLPVPTP